MSSFSKYLILGVIAVAVFDYLHPFSPRTYHRAAVENIIAESDRLLGREAYVDCSEVLARAQSSKNLDTAALRRCLEKSDTKSKDVEKTYRKTVAPPPPPATAPPPPAVHSSDAQFISDIDPDAASFVPAGRGWYRFKQPLMFYSPVQIDALGFMYGGGYDFAPLVVVTSRSPEGSGRQASDNIVGGEADALYARVNGDYGTSAPFLIRRRSILCPNVVGKTGELEFTVNRATGSAYPHQGGFG